MTYDYHKIKEEYKPIKYQKVVFFGSKNVGKTQLLNALINTIPSEKEYTPTIGAAYHEYQNLSLWDVGNAKKYASLWSMYLRHSQLVLLMFNKNDRNSFEDLGEYITAIKQITPNAKITLVSNHDDQAENTVTVEEIQSFSDQHNIDSYFEVSTHSQTNITALSQHMRKYTATEEAPENETALALKEVVRSKIKAFRDNASKTLGEKGSEAIIIITDILNDGLDTDNPEEYFERYTDILEEKLAVLQTTNASIYNSALNVTILTFACLSVIGIAALWLSGILQNNYETTGDHLMFSTFGDKQQGKQIIRDTVAETIPKKNTK
ncbi:MAG: GTP-binding protein [Gammaproteobacteria bacterium]|nr:GTP-binding protein [Gammaproteobacteria bacterium]